MITTKTGVTRAIRRFEKAADDYAFRGTIPRYDDSFPGADEEYERIEREYAAAKKAIADFMYDAVRMS